MRFQTLIEYLLEGLLGEGEVGVHLLVHIHQEDQVLVLVLESKQDVVQTRALLPVLTNRMQMKKKWVTFWKICLSWVMHSFLILTS